MGERARENPNGSKMRGPLPVENFLLGKSITGMNPGFPYVEQSGLISTTWNAGPEDLQTDWQVP